MFIQDQELRKNLEIDISATNQALSNGEWKAASVLGSIVEALLLWALSQHQTAKVNTTVKHLISNSVLTKNPGTALRNGGFCD